MCRLFGFRASAPSRAHRSLVRANNALAEQARAHPHGWGIGWFVGGEAYLVKSHAAAADDAAFRRVADQLASHTFVAHVRRATVGEVAPPNVHPFRCGSWVFAHNGTVAGFELLRPRLLGELPPALRVRVRGTTDSETVFLWLLAAVGAAGLDVEGREEPALDVLADVLLDAVARLSELAAAAGAAPPILNFLLTNGRTFLAHRLGRELYFATQKVACADAPTCREADKVCLLPRRPHGRVNHLLVASEPIGDEDHWEEVPERALLLLDPGMHLTFRGPPGPLAEAQGLRSTP